MPTKLETKTTELCQAILEEIQANGIRNRIDTFLSDTNARGQFDAVNKKGQALHEKQHSGEQLNSEEIAEFEKHRDALLSNPVAKSFLDAQDQLHEIQHSVQKRISKTLELGRMPTEEDLSEGSCGSGCGCHH